MQIHSEQKFENYISSLCGCLQQLMKFVKFRRNRKMIKFSQDGTESGLIRKFKIVNILLSYLFLSFHRAWKSLFFRSKHKEVMAQRSELKRVGKSFFMLLVNPFFWLDFVQLLVEGRSFKDAPKYD